MIQTIAITEAIISLNDAHNQFNLIRTSDEVNAAPAVARRENVDTQFFTEWFEELPELTEAEKDSLNRLKNRYFYYAADGAITEGTINIIMVSPLLETGRFM